MYTHAYAHTEAAQVYWNRAVFFGDVWQVYWNAFVMPPYCRPEWCGIQWDYYTATPANRTHSDWSQSLEPIRSTARLQVSHSIIGNSSQSSASDNIDKQTAIVWECGISMLYGCNGCYLVSYLRQLLPRINLMCSISCQATALLSSEIKLSIKN